MMKKILRTPPPPHLQTTILIPAIGAVVLSLFPILPRPLPPTPTPLAYTT